jgi:23S rRNA pseudouridine2605 synthase
MRGKDAPWYEVTLPVGRADALRNRLFQTGHFVEKTRRISFAGLELDRLAPGQYRVLSPAELNALSRSLQPGATQPSKAKKAYRGEGAATGSTHTAAKRSQRQPSERRSGGFAGKSSGTRKNSRSKPPGKPRR